MLAGRPGDLNWLAAGLLAGLLALSVSAWSQEVSGALPLIPGENAPDLRRHVWVHEDVAGDQTIDDLRSFESRFEHVDRQIQNPGFSTSVIWIRIPVRNPTEKPGVWILALDRVALETGAIYLRTQSGVQVLLDNTRGSFKQSYESFQTLAARFEMAGGEEGTLYIRYRGANWSGLEPTLRSEAAFESNRQFHNVIFLLLLGGVMSLVLYGSISFIFLGRQIFLLYAVAQVSLFLFYAHMAGFTTVFLWPDNPQAGRVVAPIVNTVFVVAMAQFARQFFETFKDAPVVDGALRIVIATGLLCILLMPADYLLPWFPRTLPVNAAYLVTFACWLILPYIAIRAVRTTQPEAWPLAIAWVSMSIFMIGLQLLWAGISGTMPLGKNSYGVMVYWEALFQALAIALRIRRLRGEALESQRQLGESLKAQLVESRRSMRLAEERSWALDDLAEKGRLLLAAGHDTRQMLAALRNYASGIRRGGLTDSTGQLEAKRVTEVSDAIDELADRLNDVLTTAVEGSRSGGISDSALALDRVSVAGVLHPLELIHGQTARAKGLRLRIRATDRSVVTDSVLLLRILSNLLGNAVKFTDQGGILVVVRPWGKGTRFQVFDTGPGVDEKMLSTFAAGGRMPRGDSSVEGVGAGLGISRQLARRLGGSLVVRSVPGHGSCFELRLPAVTPLAEITRNSARVLLLDKDGLQTRQVCAVAEDAGIVIRAFRTVRSLAADVRQHGPWEILLVDQSFVDDAGLREELDTLLSSVGGGRFTVLSYDRSAEARGRYSEKTDLIIYRPVTKEVLAGFTVSGRSVEVGDGYA